MADLTSQKCVPCEGGTDPLTVEEIWEVHSNVPTWEVIGKHIRHSFKFTNFAKALVFVNKVGEIAEEEGHHPDIKLGWGYVHIELTTHAIDGLSLNDFIVAAKIDKILGK